MGALWGALCGGAGSGFMQRPQWSLLKRSSSLTFSARAPAHALPLSVVEELVRKAGAKGGQWQPATATATANGDRRQPHVQPHSDLQMRLLLLRTL